MSPKLFLSCSADGPFWGGILHLCLVDDFPSSGQHCAHKIFALDSDLSLKTYTYFRFYANRLIRKAGKSSFNILLTS